MNVKALLAVLLALVATTLSAQETYRYAQRDTCDLLLDIWRPADGAPTTLDSLQKPSILFVFGGGFISGTRNNPWYFPWFRKMQEEGYTVISLDYRLGMKGVKVGKSLSALYRSCEDFYNAQQMGVEDVFAAVSYLHAHPELGVDTDNLVLSGSSAGAIITLAVAYDIACGRTEGLPEGFPGFKGAMSFAGAIVSLKGAPKFPKAPCPLLLCHGMADGAVAYDHLGALGRGLWGSKRIARQMQKEGWDCCIWRFTGRTHDVAAYMEVLWKTEKDFLETNVIRGAHRSMDVTVDDPSLPSWNAISLKDIY